MGGWKSNAVCDFFFIIFFFKKCIFEWKRGVFLSQKNEYSTASHFQIMYICSAHFLKWKCECLMIFLLFKYLFSMFFSHILSNFWKFNPPQKNEILWKANAGDFANARGELYGVYSVFCIVLAGRWMMSPYIYIYTGMYTTASITNMCICLVHTCRNRFCTYSLQFHSSCIRQNNSTHFHNMLLLRRHRTCPQHSTCSWCSVAWWVWTSIN